MLDFFIFSAVGQAQVELSPGVSVPSDCCCLFQRATMILHMMLFYSGIMGHNIGTISLGWWKNCIFSHLQAGYMTSTNTVLISCVSAQWKKSVAGNNQWLARDNFWAMATRVSIPSNDRDVSTPVRKLVFSCLAEWGLPFSLTSFLLGQEYRCSSSGKRPFMVQLCAN